MEKHISVLPSEVLALLQLGASNSDSIWFLDGTAGEGGHSRLILEAFPQANLFIVDRDPEMLERALANLPPGRNIVSQVKNFSEINSNDLKELGISGFQGILLDLGVSLYHFLHSGRGFTLKMDEPLDMRLEAKVGNQSAKDLLNYETVLSLKKIFQEYGEEKWALRIATTIVQERQKNKFETTLDLVKAVERSIPRKFWPKEAHPATRVFQALRIAVNQELVHAEKALKNLPDLLDQNGVMAVISFHSLEDRIVKWKFREKQEEGGFQILTKKPILPTENESSRNRASRSAKLRGLQKSSDTFKKNEYGIKK